MTKKTIWFELPIEYFKSLIPKKLLRKTGLQTLRVYTNEKGDIQKITLVWFYKRIKGSHHVENTIWKEWRLG